MNWNAVDTIAAILYVMLVVLSIDVVCQFEPWSTLHSCAIFRP